MITDLSNTFIRVNSPEESEKIQNRAFYLGWKWPGSCQKATQKSREILTFASDGLIRYGYTSGVKNLIDRDFKEITMEDLFGEKSEKMTLTPESIANNAADAVKHFKETGTMPAGTGKNDETIHPLDYKEGEYYYVCEGDHEMIGLSRTPLKKESDGLYRGKATFIVPHSGRIMHDSSWCVSGHGRKFKLATDEQKEWLDMCIEKGKFIPHDEFILESMRNKYHVDFGEAMIRGGIQERKSFESATQKAIEEQQKSLEKMVWAEPAFDQQNLCKRILQIENDYTSKIFVGGVDAFNFQFPRTDKEAFKKDPLTLNRKKKKSRMSCSPIPKSITNKNK